MTCLALVAVICLSLDQASARYASIQGAKVIGAEGLKPALRAILWQVSKHYDRPVVVSSGCRSKHGNRRSGGAKRSWHLRCMAADIKVSGVSEGNLLKLMRRLPGRGGLGTYCRNTVVHIDIGDKREWHQNCSRKRSLRQRTLVAARDYQ